MTNRFFTDFIFSAVLAASSKFTFHGLFLYILKYLPRSFTYGEAFVVGQGVTLFLVNVFLRFTTLLEYEPLTNIEKMTTITQVGLFGIAFIVGCSHFFKLFRGLAFYALLVGTGIIIVLFPIGDNMAILLLVDFILSDIQRVSSLA